MILMRPHIQCVMERQENCVSIMLTNTFPFQIYKFRDPDYQGR